MPIATKDYIHKTLSSQSDSSCCIAGKNIRLENVEEKKNFTAFRKQQQRTNETQKKNIESG